MTSTFKDQHGFARSDVTLANWRTAPFSRWSFQNAHDLVPTAEIRASRPDPETAIASEAFLSTRVETDVEGAATVRDFLDYAHTDGFVVLRDGRIVADYYAPHADVNARHLIFSISKSMTAIISGILEAQGVIDPDRLITHYLPEAGGSAYGTCSYRDVLDMRVSLDFEEAYLDPLGAFARYRRATLWNPPEPGAQTETLASFLMTLPKAAHAHGGPFFYASPNSDLLGVVIERVTGRRFSDLMSELLWQPMGAKNDAYVTVDAIGTPRCAGGICMTARDLARVGELLRTGGAANGRQIVPEAWIADMTTKGDHEAWVAGLNTMLPNGRYRSQWYQSGEADGAFCAIGIHGQWLYVDPSTKTVIVKQSSQPNPLDDELKQDIFAFFRTISAMAF
ncbi:CubicO group peptidase (beta-lactamase class C family) [Mycoplana sp. BE70]|uniref:serine hydrolase domain-containing protein n=1 Tax=Mycoplana sp. BE70 TaxID=2817775 RepID=UPI0028582796|nr:serine hydrolase [Mycoplana sp. BE70]MDR6757046.1 CubicO group peptidase (beta-lactamase class C family) [Mycoplana sp. BE70]